MVKHKKVIKIADFEIWLHFQFRKAIWQIVQNTDLEILKWFCLAGQDRFLGMLIETGKKIFHTLKIF